MNFARFLRTPPEVASVNLIIFIFSRIVNLRFLQFYTRRATFKDVSRFGRGSEFSSHEIELRNRVTQSDATLRVTNLKIFIEIHLSSY